MMFYLYAVYVNPKLNEFKIALVDLNANKEELNNQKACEELAWSAEGLDYVLLSTRRNTTTSYEELCERVSP